MNAEAVGHAIDSGTMHAQHLRRLSRRAVIEQVDDDQIADANRRLATTAQMLAQLLLDSEADPGENRNHGNSLLGACGSEKLALGEFPFSLHHRLYASAESTAESRTVI